MRQRARIGTVRGISVEIHWSVLLIVALFAWELAEHQLPAHPGHADVTDWVTAASGAVVLLLSLLAHEVSHALVARHHDVQTRSITLLVFGGVTQLEGETHRTRTSASPRSDRQRASYWRGSSEASRRLPASRQRTASPSTR